VAANVSPTVSHCVTANDAAAEIVQVNSVTDGDTVVLTDSRRVRIIGINAAELDKKSERVLRPAAIAAKAMVQQALKHNPSLQLIKGSEPQDQYGRTLAHLVLPNGESVAARLLTTGLAAATAVSPNIRCADQFLQLEAQAREQKLGLWKQENNPWFANGEDTRQLRGFHILTDTVRSVKRQRNRWRIRLSGGAEVYSNLHIQAAAEWLALPGQSVTVRGWFSRRNGISGVRLHHLGNLQINTPQ